MLMMTYCLLAVSSHSANIQRPGVDLEPTGATSKAAFKTSNATMLPFVEKSLGGGPIKEVE